MKVLGDQTLHGAAGPHPTGFRVLGFRVGLGFSRFSV